MARVLLIDPPGWQGAAGGGIPGPNVGLAFLVAALRAKGHTVALIDLNNEALTPAQVDDRAVRAAPQVIGLSAKTATVRSARELAARLRRLVPAASIVVGGPHTTLEGATLAREPCFDVVFVGEGELVFPVVCSRLAAGRDVAGLPGVFSPGAARDGRLPARRPLVTGAQLDRLPLPDYDLFPVCVRRALRHSYPLVTSRGCVFGCVYCSVPLISGRGYRKRRPGAVIAELRAAQDHLEIEGFEVLDDLFNLDVARCKRICELLIDERLNLRWSCPNGLRADLLDHELVDLMARAGCTAVMVGIESGAADVLAQARKGERLADIERGVRLLQSARIRVGGYFLIGLPGDSLRAQEESINLVQRLGIDAHFNMLVPYPGTALWEWVRRETTVLADIEEGLHFADAAGKVRPVFETPDFPARERVQAYDMVHTRLGRFDLVIPRGDQGWRRLPPLLRLLWRHDRAHLLRRGIGAALRLLTRLAHRALGGGHGPP
jgi:anaerobic magnesium-protoporphyrin IX monomethyl ester cyclase